MIPDKYFELMNKEIDGTSTKAESAQLKKYLQQHSEARKMYQSLRSLTQRLYQVQLVEPPGYLQKTIANIVSGAPSPTTHRSFWNDLIAQFTPSTSTHKEAYMEQTPQGFFSGKRGILVLSGAVVAVIAIVYLAGLYPPASTENAVGTIGGAQKASKYRSEQLSESDVVLSPTQIQELLQSDKIQTLIKSPEFKQAMNSDAFRAALNSDALRAALNNEAFRSALNSDAFRAAMNSDAFRSSMNSDALRAALNSDALRAALNNDAFRS
ncbi:MAG: hypothetical protein AAB269_03230, partial [Bacteroidota bacterium]